jgi:formylglycine-generating enzyme required for sulfatase activity
MRNNKKNTLFIIVILIAIISTVSCEIASFISYTLGPELLRDVTITELVLLGQDGVYLNPDSLDEGQQIYIQVAITAKSNNEDFYNGWLELYIEGDLAFREQVTLRPGTTAQKRIPLLIEAGEQQHIVATMTPDKREPTPDDNRKGIILNATMVRRSLMGRVVDIEGNGLGDVSVLAIPERQPSQAVQAATDEEGYYYFVELGPGTYYISPFQTGYFFLPFPAIVSISGDSTSIPPNIKAVPSPDAIPWNSSPETITVTTPAGTEHEMVLVPGGEFLMGWRQTARVIHVDAFYIDLYEVTNAQWDAFGVEGWIFPHASIGSYPWPGPADHPVAGLEWRRARDYCEWAGLRLATESEWEKAARGTDGRPYPWGWEFDQSKTNWGLPSGFGPRRDPVDSYPDGVSTYGVYGMVGNLLEYVEDRYSPPDECCNDHVIKGRGNTWERSGGDEYTHTLGVRCAKSLLIIPR